MDYDESTAESKLDEIRDAALSAGPATQGLPATVLESVLNAFATITPPEEPEITVGLVTISGIHNMPKAESRKPGNVVFSWGKFLNIVPDISLAALGASTLPMAPAVSAALGCLYIWNKIWRGSLEEFSDAEAVTILALWQNRNGKNEIEEDEGLAKTNLLRKEYSLPPLTAGHYAAVLDRLSDIKCIELKGGVIWLREWVKIKYY